jgi:hypothetical protein
VRIVSAVRTRAAEVTRTLIPHDADTAEIDRLGSAVAARAGWSDLPCVRDDRVYVVDGSVYFSRPGPRLVDSLEMLARVPRSRCAAADDTQALPAHPLP